MAASVEFLEKIKELQDVNYESERKRLTLERELNSYAHSDTRLARLKAIRLQNYWKKICEDEKRSQWRNEQLLQDFDRVESHMEELASRTERLRVMKKQYEEYIERMYPGWQEKVIFKKQQQDQGRRRVEANLHPQAAMMHAPPAGIVLPDSREGDRSTGRDPGTSVNQYVHSSVSTGLSLSHSSPRPFDTQAPMATPSDNLQYVKDVSRRAQLATDARLKDARDLIQSYPGQEYIERRDYLMSPGEVFRPQANINVEVIPSAGSTLQTISSLPTGTSLTSIQNRALAANANNQSMDGMQTWESSDLENTLVRQQLAQAGKMKQGNYHVLPAEVSSRALQEEISVEESLESPTPKQTTMKPMQNAVHIPDSTERDVNTPDLDSRSDGINSPSVRSESGVKSPSRTSTPLDSGRNYAPAPGRRSRQNSQSSILEDKSERTIYPEADVTLNGLYNLLDVVQKSFETTRQSKEFYRIQSQPLPYSVRNEIIENANKGQTLSYVDPTSVAMVALEQLPMLVYNCEGGSLLPDSYLYKPYLDPDYDAIRNNIHPTSMGFWDRLCQHFVALIKFNIMNAEEIGETFGPNIIAEDSPYEENARNLLVGMLEYVEPGDPTSPASTATLSSMPTPKQTPPRPVPKEDVPPLDLPPSQSEQSDDIFQQPALTQTAAYRQILGSTLSSHKPEVVDDSDDEDDIEKMLTKSITSPRPRPVQKMGHSVEPKPTHVAAKIPAAEAQKPSAGSGVSSDEDSPPLSPTSPPAYIPTALTSTGKSTLSMGSSKANRSAAFRIGDSDTDEDIDMGGTGKSTTSKHGDEDDDFDFYG